jgi:hypothetical protein
MRWGRASIATQKTYHATGLAATWGLSEKVDTAEPGQVDKFELAVRRPRATVRGSRDVWVKGKCCEENPETSRSARETPIVWGFNKKRSSCAGRNRTYDLQVMSLAS